MINCERRCSVALSYDWFPPPPPPSPPPPHTHTHHVVSAFGHLCLVCVLVNLSRVLVLVHLLRPVTFLVQLFALNVLKKLCDHLKLLGLHALAYVD